jgi:leucyl aminopeptidase
LDYTNKTLTKFVAKCVTEYTSLQCKEMKCNYPCGDNVSWDIQGYPTAYFFEVSDFKRANPYIHSPKDTFDKLNVTQAVEMIKAVTSVAIELA